MLNEYKPLVKDNPIADRFVNNLVSNEYFAWALFNYLSDKKLIDRNEFLEYLSDYCTLNIKSFNKDKG